MVILNSIFQYSKSKRKCNRFHLTRKNNNLIKKIVYNSWRKKTHLIILSVKYKNVYNYERLYKRFYFTYYNTSNGINKRTNNTFQMNTIHNKI